MKEPIKDTRYICPYCNGKFWSIDESETIKHMEICSYNNELHEKDCTRCRRGQGLQVKKKVEKDANNNDVVSYSIYPVNQCTCSKKYDRSGPYCYDFVHI